MKYSDFYSLLVKKFESDFGSISKLIKEAEGSVLDLGAGAGRLLNLKVEDKEIVHMDFSDDMVLELEKRIPKNSNRKVVYGNALHIPYEDESFGLVIISLNAIAEMVPIEFTMGEVKRVLKENGAVYFLVENPENKNVHVPKLKYCKDEDREFTYYIDLYHNAEKGKHEYITNLNVRENGNEYNYYIGQSFLPSELYKQILDKLNFYDFKIEGDFGFEKFDINKSDYMTIIAKKGLRDKKGNNKLKFIYDDIADTYNHFADKSDYFFESFAKENFKEYLNIDVKVLDLGCANGFIGNSLSSMGVKVKGYGVDFSKKMVDIARLNRNYQSCLHFDLENCLPISTFNFFDLSFSFGVTEFISKKSTCEMLGYIYHSLRTGGLGFVAFEKEEIESSEVRDIKKVQYTQFEIQELVKKVGIESYKLETRKAYRSPSLNKDVYYYILRVEK